MGQRRKFNAMQWKEIKRTVAKRKKRIKDVDGYNRLLVLHMRGIGKSNREIKEVLGYSEQYITELITKYMEKGMEAILTDQRTSNNRRLSEAEEREFLGQYKEMAETGQILTVEIILKGFEERTGKKSNANTIYNLLKRHGWRKVQPRPEHPGKASEAEIEAAKKNRQKIPEIGIGKR